MVIIQKVHAGMVTAAEHKPVLYVEINRCPIFTTHVSRTLIDREVCLAPIVVISITKKYSTNYAFNLKIPNRQNRLGVKAFH